MSKYTTLNKFFAMVCIMVTLASLATFTYRNHRDFYQTPIDFLIFLRAGEVYTQTGELYKRADNYADKYHPSAAIYKFPPAFQLMLMPLTKLPASIDLYIFMRLLLTGMYLLSVTLLFFCLQKAIRLNPVQSLYFGALLLSASCWLMPFFECIRWLLTEIPLLLIFIISYLLVTNNRFLSALGGLLISYAANAKIYPVFIVGYVVAQKNKAAIIGLILGSLMVLSVSLLFFGLQEHLFYLKNILPVLLNEQVTDKWVNLNIEKFMFIVGIIPEVTGKLFAASRLLFVSGLLACHVFYRENLAKNQFFSFALFITTMFFCFPNYWPQYQIFLIIPIALLLAVYIKNKDHILLVILLATLSTLFIPDLLWQDILNWESQRQSLDIDMIGKEAYQYGTGTTLLKYSPLTWAAYYLYECRALAPVILWCMQVLAIRQLHSHQG